VPGSAGNEQRWQLIRERYIHDFIDGEALYEFEQEWAGIRSEKFILVSVRIGIFTPYFAKDIESDVC
jgi:hypothetical protein